jgi:hypothetical protein
MKNEIGNSMGIGSVIFLIFLTLKLANVGTVANWSWWWVISPIWMPICIIFVIVFLIAFIKTFTKKLKK